VPAKQFCPKPIREQLNHSLWTVPAHRKCNGSFQKDEDYFYHVFYPLVARQNEQMAQILLEDLKRRAVKPQTRKLLRRVLNACTTQSPGGILLPPPILRISYEAHRVHRIVIKVAQCLFYHDHSRFMPVTNCRHVELCQDPQDLQPLFALLGATKEHSVVPAVFSYWHLELDGFHYYSLLFWKAFMFCTAFQNPV